MRLLRSDLLRLHCRAPLDEVSLIDLRRCGVESLNPSQLLQNETNKTTLRVNITAEETTNFSSATATSEATSEATATATTTTTTTILDKNTKDAGASNNTRSWEYDGDPLGQCTVLEILLLSENRLTSLAGIECCQGRLWKLDVRGNMINNLSAFGSFEQIGELDLSKNYITFDDLINISHVHIMSLRLDGNSALIGSNGSLEEYRRNVIYLLPLIWCLDGCIITAAERHAVSTFFNAFDKDIGDEVADDIRTLLTLAKRIGAPRTSTSNPSNSSNTNDVSNTDIATNNPNDPNNETSNSVFSWGSSQFVLAPLNGTVTTSNTATTSVPNIVLENRHQLANSVHAWASPSPLPTDTLASTIFHDLLLRQPFLPELQDSFRLSNFVSFHNHISDIHRRYFELNTAKVGTLIIDPGRCDISSLLTLPPRIRLDLAILMAISVQFDVPDIILQDALSILLKLDLSDQCIDDIGHLPKYGRTLLCRALQEVANLEVSARMLAATSKPYAYTELEIELLRSVPVMVTVSFYENSNEGNEDNAIGNEDRTSLELRARHAIILLSRSPSFPPLLQSKQLGNAGLRTTYSRLLTLLQIGGMAAPDLADESGGENLWKHAILKPSRNYTRPWANENSTTENEETMTGEEEKENENNIVGLGRPESMGDDSNAGSSLARLRQSRTRSRLYEGSFFESTGLNNNPPPCILLEEEPSASAAYYAASRLPKIGEKVEISYEPGKSYFPLIVDITDESNAVQLEPLSNVMGKKDKGTEKLASMNNIWLGIRELMWNPNGYWRHASALNMAAKKMKVTAKARASKLYRSSAGLSKSGVPVTYGVNNNEINSIPLTEEIESTMNTNTNQSSSSSYAPKTIGGFSANGTWDPQFVLAPPVLVQAQNIAAQRNSWKEVQQPEFSTNAGPNMNYRLVEKGILLGAPPPSAVYTLLQEQLTHNETVKATLLQKASTTNNKVSNSSLFDLTSLPNDNEIDDQLNETSDTVDTSDTTNTNNANNANNAPTQEQTIAVPASNNIDQRATTPTTAALVRDIQSRSKERTAHPKRNIQPPAAALRHEMQIMTAARVSKKKKASGSTAWYIQQPKATLVVDELSFQQHAYTQKYREHMAIMYPKKEQEPQEDERSKLVRKVANLRRRASRTRFSTMKGSVSETLTKMREKGQSAREVVRVAPHKFVPVQESVPTPLLPNTSLGSGVHARARQKRVNKWKRINSGESRRSHHLVISASAPKLGKVIQ